MSERLAITAGRPGRPRAVAGGGIAADAIALYGATIVTTALGFAFWAVAATFAGAHEVGAAGAAVAALQLIGTLSTLGLGSIVIAEVDGRATAGERAELVRAALWVSALVGAAAAAAVAATAAATDLDAPVPSGPAGAVLFTTGCAGTALALVLDLALVGHRRSSRQLARNAVFAASKLALLPLFGWAADLTAEAMLTAWVAGIGISLVWMLAAGSRRRAWLARPHLRRALRGRWGAAAAHHALNVADHCAMLALPLLVAGMLGDTANAGFYLAVLVAGFAWMVPAHLGTALFATAARDRGRFPGDLRRCLAWSTAAALVATAASAVAGEWALGRFGTEFAAGAGALVWLAATTLPFAVRAFYGAVCRVERRLARGATATALGAALNLAACAATVHRGIGPMAAALFASSSLQALVLWPTVRRAITVSPGLDAPPDLPNYEEHA